MYKYTTVPIVLRFNSRMENHVNVQKKITNDFLVSLSGILELVGCFLWYTFLVKKIIEIERLAILHWTWTTWTISTSQVTWSSLTFVQNSNVFFVFFICFWPYKINNFTSSSSVHVHLVLSKQTFMFLLKRNNLAVIELKILLTLN